jgi:hypothetical protein
MGFVQHAQAPVSESSAKQALDQGQEPEAPRFRSRAESSQPLAEPYSVNAFRMRTRFCS